jgi:hypothetical protein
MRGRARLAVATCAAVLAVAAPAEGHVAAHAPGEVVSGPVLTSDGAAFVDSPRGFQHVKLLASDGTVRVLKQFDTLLRRPSSGAIVAASPGHVAVADVQQSCFSDPDGTGDIDCEPSRVEYREAGASDAASRPIDLCRHPPADPFSYDVDITDEAVAYIGCNAADAHAVVVRSLSDPASPPFVVTPPSGRVFEGVRIAGRYVAAELTGRTPPVLIVYDRVERRELFRVEDWVYDRGVFDNGGFALQDDGTLALRRPEPAASRLCPRVTLYTPAEPFAHELAQRACTPNLAISAGRLLFDAPQPAGSQLTLAELGGWPQVVAARSIVDSVDLDPARAAYTDSTCTYDSRVVISGLDELRGIGPLPPERCPIRFAGKRPVVERRDGGLAVRVACARGCFGRLDVVPVGRRSSPWRLAFRLRPHAVKAVTGLRLFHRGQTTVRRRCTITLWSLQPDGTEKKVRLVRRLRIVKHA